MMIFGNQISNLKKTKPKKKMTLNQKKVILKSIKPKIKILTHLTQISKIRKRMNQKKRKNLSSVKDLFRKIKKSLSKQR